MTTDRVILHSDLNNFYASVECLFHPELATVPMAVCGDAELRHGIVLAKNMPAKLKGVTTGETIWQARSKCPNLQIVPPRFDAYMRYSRLVRAIYARYTDQVESFGLDECWLDVTASQRLYGTGPEIADRLRHEIREELGLTVSVGVSFNKVFAKLGSDMKKPDATTVITRENFHEKVWPLPADTLLFVGKATFARLQRMGIRTIGDLACTKCDLLLKTLGKSGHTLWIYANGLDEEPVANINAQREIKSISNSTTCPRDLKSEEEIAITMRLLAESVSGRLRAHDLHCSTVQIGIRDPGLHWYQRQTKLPRPTNLSTELFAAAMQLFRQNHPRGLPVRSISLCASGLLKTWTEQLTLFPDPQQDEKRHQKAEKQELVVDDIRRRFGHSAILRGVMLKDESLATTRLHGDNTDHENIDESIDESINIDENTNDDKTDENTK